MCAGICVFVKALLCLLFSILLWSVMQCMAWVAHNVVVNDSADTVLALHGHCGYLTALFECVLLQHHELDGWSCCAWLTRVASLGCTECILYVCRNH